MVDILTGAGFSPLAQVMDTGCSKIKISFIPLLANICDAVGLEEPVYNCLDLVEDIAYVLVRTKTGPEAFVFPGEENDTLEESCESAAQQMVLFLVRKYGVKVVDVNIEARLASEECASLFNFMRNKFQSLEKEMAASSSNQLVPIHSLISVQYAVSIDFLPLLKDVVRKFGIPVTPLEVTSLSSGQHVAWFTFEVPGHVPSPLFCVGEKARSFSEAKESAARKGLAMMVPLYKFHVEDVNYHFLADCHYNFQLERESYVTIKERVSGLSDDLLPRPCLVEQDLLTPRGDKNMISSPFDPPPAPKKTSFRKRPRAYSDVHRKFAPPAELETVFKLKKHAISPGYCHAMQHDAARRAIRSRRVSQPYQSRRAPSEFEPMLEPPLRRQRVGISPSNYEAETSAACNTSVPVINDASISNARLRRRSRGRKCKVPAAAITEPIFCHPPMLSPPTFCLKCGAKKFAYEPLFFCCSNGEVRIASNDLPEELKRLFTSSEEDAVHFRSYSRLYNNMFAFSSLGGSINCKTHKGVYVFRLHGQIYHFLPDLIPEDGNPKFLQLYFYDSQHEGTNRATLFKELRADIIDTLMYVMQTNPYASFFKSLREITIDENTTIHINKNIALDQRVYNAPTSDEVAAIWTDRCATDGSNGPYIVVHGKSEGPRRIQHYYGCYDPLQYPLLFPRGDNGWHPGIPKIRDNEGATSCPNRCSMLAVADADNLIAIEETSASQGRTKTQKNVSCREYYCFMFQIRGRNYTLFGGRLLLQFIVDMYVKLENTRLDFFRHNQPTIRADLYQGILDMATAGETNGSNIGSRIILPPSFIGGPRDMRRRYLNAMSLVQKFGKPDIFATMTCNPNWPEIKNELREGEMVQNRPDLIARIFHSKLRAAKEQIMEKEIFGKVAALIYVVEFQKRGLPHAHFLIILAPPYKIKAVEDFDKFISAEIPTPSRPNLRASVLNHMMHGPCGDANPSCPCMKEKEGKRYCKSKFPKQFSAYTTSNNDGYPLYRRRDTGERVIIRRNEMDNRWVIPYNPYLLSLFDCHFNVEICSTIQAVKYLYKYVYKGHDRIAFSIGQPSAEVHVDEIEQYQSGRWISPPEAAWRIFGFDLYEMYPPVMPLQVHCENLQSVQFRADESLSTILADPRRSRTPLTKFFRINATTDSPQHLYSEFPENFVWNTKDRTWTKRKKGRMIGRLTFVGPSEADRYYLRTLLANVRGPTSFNDLKTVDGNLCHTYQEACLRRGLIEHSNSAEKCLDEAVTVQMPQSLRRLFVTVLIFCQPPNPKQLWDKYYPPMSEDFLQRHPASPSIVLQMTAERVEQLLETMGKSLSDFALEHLKTVQNEEFRVTRDIRDALAAPLPEQYIVARKQLNVEQRIAYKAIISHVKRGLPGAFFIDGPGGTGKTFLYGALYGKVRLMHKIILPTASSGIAAAGLPSGRTAHSRFKLPLEHETTLTCNVPKQGSLAALLRETSVIIWDEAPMAHKANIHALDALLRDLCDPTAIFGGKIVVFGGDFRQVLPVVPKKSQSEAVGASLVSSPLWASFIRFELHQNMRAREDPAFSAFLLDVGNGKLQQQERQLIPLPPQIVTPLSELSDPINELLKIHFPTTSTSSTSPEIFNDRAILCPRNDAVDSLNQSFIESFQGESFLYKSFDTVLDDTGSIYPTEFLHTLCPGGMSPHELMLKEGCPVILLRNIDPSSGLCNGTRLICKKFFSNMLLCEIAVGSYKGNQTMLPRINLRPSTSSHYPFQFQRKQFPVKLSFAMTINKSQGQTLDEVGLYLQQPCFSHGQLYVALSRARKASKVRVLTSLSSQQQAHNEVKNIVSFEVLSRAGII